MKKKEQIPQFINSPLNNPMLNYNVYYMKLSEKILVRLILFGIGGCIGLMFYGGLFKQDGIATTATYISNIIFFCIIGLLAMKFAEPIYKQRCIEKQKNALKLQFKDMLESLSASVSSGSNIQAAFQAAYNDLKMQYNENEYIVREMQEILNGVAQNINMEVMIKDFGERSGNEDILCFADVFEICYRKGGDLKSVIQKTHSVIGEKIAVSDEITTKLTSNKMQHNVMSIMPVLVVAMLRFTNEMFAANFATPIGIIANTIAIGIFLGAYKYGLKIVDIKV